MAATTIIRPISTTPSVFREKRVKERNRKAANISAEKASISADQLWGEDEEDDEEEEEEEGPTRKGDRQEKKGASAKVLAVKAVREMDDYYKVLNETLVKHLSLNVNLKSYEDLSVTLPNGETHRLVNFARITMKSPRGPIALNFADNPAAIKPAKDAIIKMAENVNPQQDGIVLYVPIPKITRERREELAKHSASRIFNEYKMALNEVFKKYTRQIEKATKVKDEVVRLNNGLLNEKKKFEKLGEDKVNERREMLLKEIEF